MNCTSRTGHFGTACLVMLYCRMLCSAVIIQFYNPQHLNRVSGSGGNYYASSGGGSCCGEL